jgi:hypothetical protein
MAGPFQAASRRIVRILYAIKDRQDNRLAQAGPDGEAR